MLFARHGQRAMVLRRGRRQGRDALARAGEQLLGTKHLATAQAECRRGRLGAHGLRRSEPLRRIDAALADVERDVGHLQR